MHVDVLNDNTWSSADVNYIGIWLSTLGKTPSCPTCPTLPQLCPNMEKLSEMLCPLKRHPCMSIFMSLKQSARTHPQYGSAKAWTGSRA